MTIADKVTAGRLVMAPLFYVLYFLPEWLGVELPWLVPILWLLFAAGEISDLLDGKIARSRNEVGDFGKLFDPFADTLARISYFFCFVLDGFLPAFLFILVLYREFSISFLRMIMMGRGVALGARSGGKLKAFGYMLTGLVSLLAIGLRRLGFSAPVLALQWIAIAFFALSTILAYVSFFDYFSILKKTKVKETEGKDFKENSGSNP